MLQEHNATLSRQQLTRPINHSERPQKLHKLKQQVYQNDTAQKQDQTRNNDIYDRNWHWHANNIGGKSGSSLHFSHCQEGISSTNAQVAQALSPKGTTANARTSGRLVE
jgi:hypothetical protein